MLFHRPFSQMGENLGPVRSNKEESMRTLTKLLLAGAGIVAAAGAAVAASDRAHIMNVALPDGTIAQVHYVGNVAPKIMVAPAVEALPVAVMDVDPFAMLDRISWEMDRRMDAMMRQASALSANGKLSEATLRALPPGASYSFTSFSSGNGGSCRQSVQVTSLGENRAPEVIRQSAGDCSPMNSRTATPAVQPVKPTTPVVTPASLEKPATRAVKGPII